MSQIPFNVSARTAMLIGRENIANSKGAIIELVKNCYDADSGFCIIYIDNKLSVVQEHITLEERNQMIADGIPSKYFENIYTQSGSRFILNSKASNEDVMEFAKEIQKLATIYIIDAGDGMSQETIINHWMTIGTDNKLYDHQTRSKRIKSGAKGIGRFALDKLGAECTMTTIPDIDQYAKQGNTSPLGSVWQVNWHDFEGNNKTITQVTADLEYLQPNTNLISATNNKKTGFNLEALWESLKDFEEINEYKIPPMEQFGGFCHGTVLKISKPNDVWNSEFVAQLFKDLEILIPPKDIVDFRVFLTSSLEPNKYGEILGSDCEDFDYKIEAHANDQEEVVITIYREEFEFERVPQEFFEREHVKRHNANLKEKKHTVTYKFSQLLHGFNDKDKTLERIGPFDFSFYFLKRTTTSKDSQRFFYKGFDHLKRKQWLDQFAGIKIYRDNFRVRPYGEVSGPSFDWLGLGLRQAASPAGVAKIEKGFKVRPQNIAGAIKISRLTNLEFADKSSRDGLQETKTFQVFKNLIISIIDKLEDDRSSIATELSLFSKLFENDEDRVDEDTEKLAKLIIEQEKEKRKSQLHTLSSSSDDKLAIVAKYAEEAEQRAKEKAEEYEKLLEEQKLLRGMASSGIVAASFGHDLSKTKEKLNYRFDELIGLLASKVTPIDFDSYEEFDNPFEFMKDMKKDDRNIAMWLSFSLGFTRKDKRKRKQIFLDQYFQTLKSSWLETLEDRGIIFTIECPPDLKMRAFEIDFDSIFLNLLVNSIEAFKNSKKQVQRKINITCLDDGTNTILEYVDTGPGLPDHLTIPEVIFEPLYTTKRDSVGEEVGTGLGMWIIKVISDEYQANVKLLQSSVHSGFGINFCFPQKYKKKE